MFWTLREKKRNEWHKVNFKGMLTILSSKKNFINHGKNKRERESE